MRIRLSIVVPLILLFVGCSGGNKEIQRVLDSPIDVESQVDEDVDLSGYTTWSWLMTETNVAGAQAEIKDPQVRSRIVDAVQGEMFKRGFVLAEDQSDLVMNFHVAIKNIDQNYIDAYYEGRYTPSYREGSGSKKGEWTEGTLILLLFDADTRQMIWRASAQTEVTADAPTVERDKRIQRIVSAMFEKLPAKTR